MGDMIKLFIIGSLYNLKHDRITLLPLVIAATAAANRLI